MRRVLFVAALFALLAACSLETPEGARCDDIGGVGQCPEGQRCGVDGTCSLAAMACEEPICTASSCGGPGNKTLNRCVEAGVCAALVEQTCSPHQTCNELGGSCDCDASVCDGTKVSFCDAGGELVACHAEAGTSCHYADPPVSCGAFRECSATDATSSECACKASPECTEAGTFCRSGNTLLVTCGVDDACLHVQATESCDPGESCVTGACACPGAGPAEGDSCSVIGDTTCDGPVLLTCAQKVADSPCNVWTRVEDCSGSGLACTGSAPSASCACPPVEGSPRTLFADALTEPVPGLVATGANVPGCRFSSLGAAIEAASDGDTVKATGADLGPMVFKEGPLTVRPGMTLTTTDAPPAPGNYVIEPTDAVGTSTLVTLRPGATFAGFVVRNTTASGAGLATSCPDLADTAEVTVEAVHVGGLGTGDPAPRFLHGLAHSGRCSLSLRDSIIEGAADSGVHVLSQSTTATLIMTGNTVQRNKGATAYRINGIDRLAGGVALRGSAPSAVTFTGNKVLGNEGDQVVVFMSGTLNMSSPACGGSSNVLACYAAPGVGISTAASLVDVTNMAWARPVIELLPDQDYVVATGSTLAGTTQGCGAFTGACPAAP